MAQQPITFEGFRFDADTGELSGPDGVLRLGPQPARLLGVLLGKPGVLVTRDELKVALWPGTVVEADQGLNFCVLQLRTALGDDAGKARFIETLPRRGYRFIAKIDGTAPPNAETAARAETHTALPTRRRITFGVAGVCALIATWMLVSTVRDANRNVAIMPLAAKPEDPAWLVEVSADITDRLVSLLTTQTPGKIGVIGPLTTRKFMSDTRPVTEIGRDLHVGYVLSGAVRVSDSTVFVQVVRVADGVHICVTRRRAIGVNLDTLMTGFAAATAAEILKDAGGNTTKPNCSR